jgi:hypothetical protein
LLQEHWVINDLLLLTRDVAWRKVTNGVLCFTTSSLSPNAWRE